MLLHVIPIFRGDYSLEDELSFEHVLEHLAKSLTETTDELRELKFVTEDFSGFTEIKSFVIVCETRGRKIERVVKLLLKVFNISNLTKVLSS